jgi:glutaminyl-peptide cyclotransferase
MRGPVGRTGRVAVAAFVLGLMLVGGAAAFYYGGLPRGSTSSSTSASSSSSTTASVPSSAPVYGYEVLNAYPHDTGAFTEGLVYYNGSLYESTGLYGNSSLRRVDLETGKILQIYDLPSEYFGEGITIFNDTIIQLTYQNHVGFVYDLQSFKLLRTFPYPDEGWGLTDNGTQLIVSDGTANIYFLNPQTFQRTGSITVHDNDTQIVNLNELEYINGSIFANVWLTNRIAVIDPQSGQVTAWIDLTGIENLTGCHCDLSNDVLNGIAYDAQHGRLYVTGKMWPNLFQIAVVPPLPQLHRPLESTASPGEISSAGERPSTRSFISSLLFTSTSEGDRADPNLDSGFFPAAAFEAAFVLATLWHSTVSPDVDWLHNYQRAAT